MDGQRGSPAPLPEVAPVWQVLTFPGVAGPLVLPDGAGLEAGLAQVVRGWTPACDSTVRPKGEALACAVPDGAGNGTFTLHSVNFETPMPRLAAASVICGLVADLGQSYFEEKPGALALHCGAFRWGGRLIAVSGPPRAGKSTLIARMTAEPDCEVFCDDILPVRPDGQGVALGIAPRLRLPLPEGASAAFREHVEACLGPRDARYGYVCAGTLALHGTLAPLSVLVKLDRRAEGPARLHPLAVDEALTELLQRNMADQATPDAAFARGAALIGGMTCLRLVYADLEEAVALLRRAFAADGGLEGLVAEEPAVPAEETARTRAAFDPDAVVARTEGVAVRRLGSSAFLWRPEGTMIWQLNPIAAAVWALLEIPGSAREIAEALAEVWTDVPGETLLADVVDLLDGLVAEDFAEMADVD
jgi:hypothetical protein